MQLLRVLGRQLAGHRRGAPSAGRRHLTPQVKRKPFVSAFAPQTSQTRLQPALELRFPIRIRGRRCHRERSPEVKCIQPSAICLNGRGKTIQIWRSSIRGRGARGRKGLGEQGRWDPAVGCTRRLSRGLGRARPWRRTAGILPASVSGAFPAAEAGETPAVRVLRQGPISGNNGDRARVPGRLRPRAGLLATRRKRPRG